MKVRGGAAEREGDKSLELSGERRRRAHACVREESEKER